MRPKTIRHFEMLEQIGQGGMGEVYRARDTQLKRTVAIKVLSIPDDIDATMQRRFVQEAQATSALNHPNIITVHDAASEDETYFIVMEYVQGTPLSRLTPAHGMNLEQVLKIAIQVADGLSCAHAAGIVHRDLKPSNIMVRGDGLVKVLDFGLAKWETNFTRGTDATLSSALTEAGTVLGTPCYMSPEQVEGRDIDARSDIFSFGIVLFGMMTGRLAFHGDNPAAVMAAILRDQPEWPEHASNDLQARLQHVVDRCMEKSPGRRYQSIAEVRDALEELRENSGAKRTAGIPVASERLDRVSVGVAILAIVVVLAGVVVWRTVKREVEPAVLKLRPLTDDEGTTRSPAISPDGKLVAYASNRAGEGLDIWVQQITPGARPIRLTRDPADELAPTFSPDGSQIAFTSLKDGGSLYVAPALGGEERLITRGSAVASPRFSPDGKWLAVAPNALIFPVAGGPPRRLTEGSSLLWSPVWSPDGKHVLYAGDIHDPAADWSIVPVEGGTPVKLGFQNSGSALAGPREWMGDSIIYSDGDLKRVRVHSSPWRVSGPAESLTSSPGVEMEPRAIPHPTRPGRLMVVFANGEHRSSLWEMLIDHNQGVVASGARRLSEDRSDRHTPTLSVDGRRLAYVRKGLQGFEIHARELDAGTDRVLTRLDTMPRVRLSPDGSTVAINPQGQMESETALNLISWWGGEIQKFCGSCGLIYDWSPDGKRILYRQGNPMRFSDVVVASRKKRVVAMDDRHSIGAAVLSRDERWIAIHYDVTENIRPIYIAPARDGVAAPREQWWPLIDQAGTHVRPWWSPDGELLYYISDADGKAKIWGQRLTAGKRPAGKPFIVYAPPGERFSLLAGAAFGPALGPRSLIFQMIETNTNIWLGE